MIKGAIAFYSFIVMAVVAIGFATVLIFLSQDEPIMPQEAVLKSYENKERGFSIKYPEEDVLTTDSSFPMHTGIPLARIGLPESGFSGTNLVEAAFMAGAADSQTIVGSCLLPGESEATQEQIAEIEGNIFKIFSSTLTAAENLYETTSYRTLKNGTCYELVMLMHSGNIGNYPEGSVKQFDKEATFKELKKILETFKFGS